MARLDAELEMLLLRQEFLEQNSGSGTLGIEPDEALYVAITFSGEIDALQALGFVLGNTVGNVAFGSTTLAGLRALARHPQVLAIERQRRSELHLDGSVPGCRASRVWSRNGQQFTGYTGRNVIVGVIDTGIDFRHKSFRRADGSTRILRIWDQTLTPVSLESSPETITDPLIASTPTPLGYGVEYTQRHIDDTLTEQEPVVRVRHRDTNGHGTHVAGTSSGDGSQNGLCHGAFNYIGVAPDSDIIAVRLWGLTKGDTNAPATPNSVLVDAVRYLMDQARKADKPLVVNMSLGRFGERMDGSSATAQALDTLLTANSAGRAIVISAGNDGDSGFHAAAPVAVGAANALRLNFSLYEGDTKSRTLVVRYTGAHLSARVTAPAGGAAGVVGFVAPGATGTGANANGTGGLVQISNAADRIVIGITPPAGGRNLAGTWRLELRNAGAAPTPIDAFCLFGSSHDRRSPRFTNAVTSLSTLNEHATGFETIGVGSYRIGKRLSAFSSRGPTLERPARAVPKPEIAAPGEDIAAPGIDSDRGCCERCFCDCCQDFYVDKSGTSTSAPHVAGAVALMLHKNPGLTHTQIRDFLRLNAMPKYGGASPEEDAGWGGGRLDVEKAVDAVPEVNPPLPAPEALAPGAVAPHPLQARLTDSERGAQFVALYQAHAREVWNLVQHNRRVATAWHRARGPMWVRLAMKAIDAPQAELPLQADGTKLVESLQRVAVALERCGSPDLRRDVALWKAEFARIDAISKTLSAISLPSLIDLLGRASPTARGSDGAPSWA